MHTVAVSDPWFGGYFKVSTGAGPIFLIGPCFSRTLRLEHIHGAKGLKRRSFSENVVFHDYVEGTVTGDSSGQSTPFPVFGPNGGSDSYSQSYYGGTWVYKYETTYQGSGAGSGTFAGTVRVTKTTYYKGVMQGSPERGFLAITFKSTTDRYTGSTTYSNPVISGRGGLCGPAAYVAAASNPFGQGGDTLGGSLLMIQKWINDTVQSQSPVGSYRSARDEAIWNAIDSIALGNTNPLNDANDAIQPLAAIMRLGQALSRRSNWREVVRGMASLHLFWDYVIQTNLMTADEYSRMFQFLTAQRSPTVDFLARDMVGRGTAVASCDGGTVTYHAKVVVSSGWGAFAGLAQLELLGIAPSMGDVWDLAPYSFCVDWLLPVQQTLERMSNLAAITQLPIQYILVSRKVERSKSHTWSDGGHTFIVSLKCVDYSRKVGFGLPPDMGLGNNNFRDPRKQALNAASLILQR